MKQATRHHDILHSEKCPLKSGKSAQDSDDVAASGTEVPPKAPRLSVKRLWPLLVLAAGTVLFFAAGLDRYVSFEMLHQHRETLLAWVTDDLFLTAGGFMLAYAAVVAFSLPGAAVLSITGGFLFGTWLGMILSVSAATAGATVIFLIAKTTLGEPLRARAGRRCSGWNAAFAKMPSAIFCSCVWCRSFRSS